VEIRDQRVLEGIEKHRYLRADQVAELYFRTIKNSDQRKKKAAARLLVLYRSKLVQRTRYPGDPFIYFARGNKYSHKLQHYLTITDVLLQILDLIPASSKVEYEVEYSLGSGIIADLVIRYSNPFRQEKKTYYIEIELDSSGSIIEKLRKYEEIEIEDSTVVVIAKHRYTIEKIQSTLFTVPIRAIDIRDIPGGWNSDGSNLL